MSDPVIHTMSTVPGSKGKNGCGSIAGKPYRSLLALAAVLPLILPQTASSVEEAAKEAPLGDRLVVQAEKEVTRRLEAALKGGEGGARDFLAGRRIEGISLSEVTRRVRGDNPTLKGSEEAIKAAKSASERAQASFDPLINANVSFSTSQSWERHHIFNRWRKNLEDWEAIEKAFDDQAALWAVDNPSEDTNGDGKVDEQDTGDGVPDVLTNQDLAAAFGCINIDGETLDYGSSGCQKPIEMRVEREFASSESDVWADRWKGSVGLRKLFRFGGSTGLTLSSSYTPTAGDFEKSVSVGFLKTAVDLGRHSWVSTLSGNVDLPFPTMKNYGEEGNLPAVSEKMAAMGAERAAHDHAGSELRLTRDGELAYWELVRSLLKLNINIVNLSVLQRQLARTERLYEVGNATDYGLTQVRTLIENARDQEEIAWNDVITRANELAYLMDLPAETLVVPKGFAQELSKPVPLDGRDSVNTAMKNRPELKALMKELDSNELFLRHKENQLLPDLKFVANFSFSQTDAILGYPTWTDSVAKIFEPDANNFYVGVAYRIPLGNQAAESQKNQAKDGRDQTQDRLRNQEISITQEVNSALADAQSRRSQVNLAEKDLSLKEMSLGKANEFYDAGKVTEFEVLQRIADVQVARTSYVEALINYRQSFVRLQAAEGILAERKE